MILFDYDKATYLMRQWGFDVLLPHTLLNAGYLADHWKHDLYTSIGPYTTFDKDEPYQLLVGLPRERDIEPFITCRRASEEGDMYNWGMWIEDRRIWGPNVLPRSTDSPLGPATTQLYGDPYQAAAVALRERGLDQATIGVEMRFLGVEAFEKLRRLLPEAQFRDAADLFLELRVVKCAEEIRRIRIAAQATQRALSMAIECMRPGMTGLDLERVIGAEHYRAGVRHEWLHTQIGPLGIDVVGPHPYPIEGGQIIRIDTGASYRHYQSDMSPMISVGEPAQAFLRIYAGMRAAIDTVLETLRPGISAAHLFEKGNATLAQEGFDSYLMYLGHGIGRNVHEEPVLASDSKWVLAQGMTLSIELITVKPDMGMIGLEDNVAITADGHEDLSTIGRRLHVVAA
jgi:Xaa-Pro aminopeptidase